MNDTNIEPISHILSGKQIAIVCGGGIAAIEMPRVARELRRHGAAVQFFITQKCLQFVGMTSLEWSSQNPVVLEPTGLSEHVCTGMDAVLVAPATADLLAQARYGLCNNGATTLIQSAFGKEIPIGFVPTMHQSMWNSPIIQDNCDVLGKMKNVFFLQGRKEEYKEKIPDPAKLALIFAHYVNKLAHTKPSVLISLGSTRVMLDSVRCLSNLSTGKLGWEAVKLFYGMGHKIHAVVSQTNFEIEPLQDLLLHRYENYSEIYDFFKSLNVSQIDGFFHFLAASDYLSPHQKTIKLSSDKENQTFTLKKASKIRDLENIRQIPYKFLCKLTSNDDTKSQMNVKKFIQLNHAQSLLWNTSQGAWNNPVHQGFFVTKHKNTFDFEPVAGKKEIALKIYKEFMASNHQKKGNL